MGGRARFRDALWIVILGTIIGVLIGIYLSGILASIVMFFLWLVLVKHFFNCGWVKAIVVSIVAVITFVVISMLLEYFLGISLFGIF